MAIEESTDRASEMMVNLLQSLTSTNIVTPDQLGQVSCNFSQIIDHSSIGLKRLRIQPVFSEARLVFGRGFYITTRH